MTDPHAVARSVIELLGGPERARQVLDEEHSRIVARWEQDTDTIGRILRSHLFVEHFLGQYISASNPKLGSIDDARLTFFQKVSLVGDGAQEISHLLPGVRHLNVIRNRLAHSLHSKISQLDSKVFLAIDQFRAMREALWAPKVPSSDPIDILEEFAKHAGLSLYANSTPNKQVWAEAIRRAQANCPNDPN